MAGTSAPRPGTIRAQVIVTAGTQSAVLLLDVLPPLADRLADVAGEPTLHLHPQRLHVELTIPSSTLTAAAPAAVGATLNALAEVLGADHGCVPTAVTVETPRARRERRDAAARRRDFLGVSEIAALFGVARQSAHRSTQLASFPEPLTRLATGPVWLRGDVEQWRGRRDLMPIQAGSPRPTPGQRHRTDLARLITEAAAGGADIDPAVVSPTRRDPHYLTGSALATAVAGLGGPAAVAEQLGVTPRTVQRWTSTHR